MSRSLAVYAGALLREQMCPGCLPLSLLVFSVTVSIAGVAPDGTTGHIGGSDRSDERRLQAAEREGNWRERDLQSSGWEVPLRDTGKVLQGEWLEEGMCDGCCMLGSSVEHQSPVTNLHGYESWALTLCTAAAA